MSFSSREEPSTLFVRFSASVSETDAEAFVSRVETAAASLRGVLIDLRAAEDFELGARPVLLLAQRAIKRRGWRSVYLADRPIFRGLGLKVVHDADDENASVTASQAQAEAWLDQRGPRLGGKLVALSEEKR